jgi:hypothetical protein
MLSSTCLFPIRRPDIASITSSVDASSKLTEFKNELKAACLATDYLLIEAKRFSSDDGWPFRGYA